MTQELSDTAKALGLSVELNELDGASLLRITDYLMEAGMRLMLTYATGRGRWQDSDPPQLDDAPVVISGLIMAAKLGAARYQK